LCSKNRRSSMAMIAAFIVSAMALGGVLNRFWSKT
jgi:hypothetical protein